MRILCVTNLFPDTTRPGFASFNRQQFINLASMHEISVISPVPWTHAMRAFLAGRRPAPLEDCRSMRISYPVYFYTPKILRDQYWRFYRMSIARAFSKAVRETRPQLVYGTWAYPDCRASADLARRHHLPFVMRIHGSDVNDFFLFRGRKRLILEAMEMADAVISVNEDLAGILAAEGVDRGKIYVIYNGIDRSIFHPSDRGEARSVLGLDPDARIVLFAGNLKPVKGLDLLLHAFSALRTQNAELHIIGQGPLGKSLQKTASALGAGDRVFFHGSIRHQEMAVWYAASDIFCLPSLNEGTPNVILEALACGIPVIASGTGGIPEVVSESSGILFEPGDEESLGKALKEGLAKRWDPENIDCPAGPWLKNAHLASVVFEKAASSYSRAGAGTRHAKMS